MSVCEETLRRELVETSHRIWQNGWVANHDGNLSARLGENLLCTPTSMSKGDVRPEHLIVVDTNNTVVSGTRRSFSELKMHRAAYAARPDIGVVIHAHPPATTAFAVSRAALGHPFMAEPVVSLGAVIPRIPLMLPGDPDLPMVFERALAQADVLILDGHGALVVGGSFEQAYLRLELLEHLAKIALAAQPLGGPQPLPDDLVAKLSAKGRPLSMPDHTPSQSERYEAPAGEEERPDLSELVASALQRLR
jgi:L-fuculose-phosphate aldolase